MTSSIDPMNAIERIFRSASSFRSKQRMVIMLACTIVLVVTLTSFLAYSYFIFKEESRERLGSLCNIIGADIGATLAFGDGQAIAKSLAVLRNDLSIKQVFILNEAKQIIAYYDQKGEIASGELQLKLEEFRTEALEDFFDLCPGVERPIVLDGTRLGSIFIEQDEAVIIKKMTDATVIGAIILLFALGFSYLLADRFQRVITEPVTAMASAMKEVTEFKNYSKRVSASSTDEMSQLAERFNEMLSEIELRDEDLVKRHEQLWQLTVDLTNSNILYQKVVKSNQRLEEITKAKSDFLANMSHELRTPLNSVIGFSELLQDRMYGPINDKQMIYVSCILSSGKHLLSLINDILDLSKVESGKMELELTDLSIRETLDASLIMLRQKALKETIELSLYIAPEADVIIVADQRKLKQILFNLLSNAVKFTSAHGRVDVRVVREGSLLKFAVSDTGIGISEEDLPKLFKVFTQLESVYCKKFEGTGLGLALTKQLVEMQGGTINVESLFGTGSTFSFTIPISQVVKKTVHRPGSSKTSCRGDKHKTTQYLPRNTHEF